MAVGALVAGGLIGGALGGGSGALGGIFGGSGKAARKMRDNIRTAREAVRAGISESEPLYQENLADVRGLQSADPAAALNLLRGYSGASGADAQREAYEGFQDSPGVNWLRERGLRGVDSSAAAHGGLGGGNRLKALTEFSQGLALQDFQRQMAMLGGIADVDLSLMGDEVGLRQDRSQGIIRNRNIEAGLQVSSNAAQGEAAAGQQRDLGRAISGGLSGAMKGAVGGMGLFGGLGGPSGDPTSGLTGGGGDVYSNAVRGAITPGNFNDQWNPNSTSDLLNWRAPKRWR